MKKDSIPERARDLIFICWLHGKVTRTINEKISISFLARTELDVYFASRNYFQTLIIEIRLEAQKNNVCFIILKTNHTTVHWKACNKT